ncbi:MAG: hypothetical protein IT435_01740 [Phycisphaerales bacterium]|nr:hypothetical protein [Phycisphaerales bacterium]
MTDAFGDRSKRVAVLAGRLRTVQSELADEDTRVREEQLVAVLDQGLATEQTQDVPAFLDELLTWFPGGFGNADGVATASPTPAVKSKAPEPRSAAEWAAGLVQVWQGLSEAERSALTVKLTDGGVIQPVQAGVPVPPAVEQDLRAKLQLQPGEKFDANRIMPLAGLLLDFVMKIDRLAWTAWTKSLAPPTTDVRPSGPIARFVKNYMSGADSNLPGLGLTPELQRLQQLTSALVGGINDAGKNYAETWFGQLAPASIKEVAGSSAFRNQKVDCWDLYESRAGSMDREHIQREIRQAVARFVEDWMKKLNR